jgi:hypothetical protein
MGALHVVAAAVVSPDMLLAWPVGMQPVVLLLGCACMFACVVSSAVSIGHAADTYMCCICHCLNAVLQLADEEEPSQEDDDEEQQQEGPAAKAAAAAAAGGPGTGAASGKGGKGGKGMSKAKAAEAAVAQALGRQMDL